MTHRLLVLLDDHWPRDPAADWVLLDPAGRPLQQGRSAPAHWPAADRTDALLGGSQCLWLEVDLPPGPRREQPRLLAYALEEHLIGDADAQHLTPTHSRAEGELRRTGVVVLARSRLKQLIAQFDSLSRPLASLRSQLQTAATSVPASGSASPPRWVLAGDAHGGILRTGPDRALRTEWRNGAEARDCLEHLLPTALALHATMPPEALELRLAPGFSLADGPRPLPLPLVAGPAWHWWEGYEHGSELLHGDFAPHKRHARHWQALRLPVALAGLALSVFLIAGLAHILLQRHALNELEARSLALFQQALPGTPAVSPAAQLARVLERERASRGQLASDDLLGLLHGYFLAGGPAPQALDYAAGKLVLELPAEAAAGLPGRLALYGLQASAQQNHLTIVPMAAQLATTTP